MSLAVWRRLSGLTQGATGDEDLTTILYSSALPSSAGALQPLGTALADGGRSRGEAEFLPRMMVHPTFLLVYMSILRSRGDASWLQREKRYEPLRGSRQQH